MLWQVAADFRFRIAGGHFETPPSAFMHPQSLEEVTGDFDPPAEAGLFRAFIRAKDVTTVIADPHQAQPWIPALDRIARPEAVGGILLYRVAADAPACKPSA